MVSVQDTKLYYKSLTSEWSAGFAIPLMLSWVIFWYVLFFLEELVTSKARRASKHFGACWSML